MENLSVVLNLQRTFWEMVTAEGVLPMQSARQSQGANQDRTGMAQSE